MTEDTDQTRKMREAMVRNQIEYRSVRDPAVLEAMRRVPRHAFVPANQQAQAYDDRPLPIGREQTISQPYIVALMTEALGLRPGDKVLEIGTGSGYQTAVLAEIAGRVFTVERIGDLLTRALQVLGELGYDNVTAKEADGTLGWPNHGPYDAIITTAGAPSIPRPLTLQLAEGGRLVIPVGGRYDQDLLKIVNHRGEFKKTSLGGCRFVNLIGRHGWSD